MAIDRCSSAQKSTGGPCKLFWGLLHHLLPLTLPPQADTLPDGSRWPPAKLASWSTHQGALQHKDGNTHSQRPSAICQRSMQSVLTHLGRSSSMGSASSAQKPKNPKPGFCQNQAIRAHYMGCCDTRIAIIDSCSSAQLSAESPCKLFWGLLHRLLPLTLPPRADALPDESR